MHDNSDMKIAEKIYQFADLNSKYVLEVGCGDGRITSLLVGKPKVLVAIDPDVMNIRKAQQYVTGVDFRNGSGENLEFSNNVFDLVIFTLSLHHQDSELAIREAQRVLKVGGNILIIEPIIDGEVEQVFALVHNENQEKLIVQQSIEKSGLKIERSEIFNANWFFDNKEELCHSIFDYYDKPFNSEVAERIYDLIGPKSDDQPIELLDIMVIQSLKKI
jgi:SAM-dependent methyltransferase